MGAVLALFTVVLFVALAVGGGVQLRLHERELRRQDWWG